jgi:hypothetical protein
VEYLRGPADESDENHVVSFALLLGGQPEAPPALEERLPARVVATILGVKVGTLAKWRRTGRGPQGWIYVSQTLVTYPVREVQRFLEEMKGTKGGVK